MAKLPTSLWFRFISNGSYSRWYIYNSTCLKKFITGQISNKNPDNLEVKIPSGTLGARGTEFVVLSESDNKSTVVLLGPGPENSLGMIPGNLILSDGITSINITTPGYEAMVTN